MYSRSAMHKFNEKVQARHVTVSQEHLDIASKHANIRINFAYNAYRVILCNTDFLKFN